jgi:hypothetical protein
MEIILGEWCNLLGIEIVRKDVAHILANVVMMYYGLSDAEREDMLNSARDYGFELDITCGEMVHLEDGVENICDFECRYNTRIVGGAVKLTSIWCVNDDGYKSTCSYKILNISNGNKILRVKSAKSA